MNAIINNPEFVSPPQSRQVDMGTGKMNKFSFAKDPRNQSWFTFKFPQAIDHVIEVLIAGPDDQLVMVAQTSDGDFAAAYLKGGTTNTTYRLTVGVAMTTGEVQYDSCLLDVVLAGGLAIVNTAPQPVAATTTPSGAIMLAREDIAAFQTLMYAPGGGVVPANPLLPGFIFAGFAARAASASTSVPVIEQGRIENPDWQWNAGDDLFVAPNGGLTRVSPTVGIWQKIGVGNGGGSVTVRPYSPVLRA